MLVRNNIPKNSSGIYQIQSKINGKIYIGSAINLNRRIQQGHFSSLKKGIHNNNHLQKHVNKYGIQDLQFGILEFCLKEKLIEREQYYINITEPKFNNCPIAGSQLGMRHSKKTKYKMRIAKLGKKMSEETKQKLQIINLGAYHSEEARHKMRVIKLGKKHSEKTRKKMSEAAKKRMSNKENHSMYGKKHSEETRKKMSESQRKNEKCRGYTLSEETKQKMRKPKSEETKQKMKEKRILYWKNKKASFFT